MPDMPDMPDLRLTEHSYGKDGIRIVTRRRAGAALSVRDLTLGVRLSGHFGPAFVSGDNSTTLPTDALRNHAYAVAEDLPDSEPEDFAAQWLIRILAAVPAATGAGATLTIHPWAPVAPGCTVLTSAPWTGYAEVGMDRAGDAVTRGGLSGLRLMAPFGSGFSGFLRDAMTDQQDSSDRVVAGVVEARWDYSAADDLPYSDIRERVRTALAESFGIPSSGAQGTVYLMAEAALGAASELGQITVRFTARPHSPVALPRTAHPAPPGVAWAAADGPSGISEATVSRL